MADPLAAHDTRLRHLDRGERDQLRTIAQRARGVQDGVRPEYGRLYADVLHLLHVIGGEFAEGQESPYPWESFDG